MNKLGIIPGVLKLYVVLQNNCTTQWEQEIFFFFVYNNPSKITFRDFYVDNEKELISHLRYLKI